MPTYRDEHILIIAPGSRTTLAQLGLPESFTPARLKVKSRMFAGENAGEWEPYKVRRREKARRLATEAAHGGRNDVSKKESEAEDGAESTFEEDFVSDDGAVWPITAGKITNWDCFFALMHHVHNTLDPPLHTPILIIAQPHWTRFDLVSITGFFFEKFRTPALAVMDSAQATSYAYGLQTATIVDIGADKADITAVVDFVVQDVGREIAVPGCGGEAMTRRLLQLLSSKGFTREMCEQLKKSPICEILPPGTTLPKGPARTGDSAVVGNPVTPAVAGADGSGSDQPQTVGSTGQASGGPGLSTDAGADDGVKDEDDTEGILDVATIVASGKMKEYLARKEVEKVAKAASKKKGLEAGHATQKPVRLRNADKEQNTFLFEDHALLDALKGSNMDSSGVAEASAVLDEGPQKHNGVHHETSSSTTTTSPTSPTTKQQFTSTIQPSTIRRELTVGVERFLCASEDFMSNLTAAIHRTILTVPSPTARAVLWDSIIIVGAGAAVRGFREALLATLTARFLISPSSATMFTSEIPSATSTPARTGANTPQPEHIGSMNGIRGGGNPLLYAATTAHAQQQHQLPLASLTPGYLHPNSAAGITSTPQHHQHASQAHSVYGHSQTPTSIKLAKLPEYFPEWKDVGPEESAMFLGAQVAAKVVFLVDQGQAVGLGGSKGYMTRSDFNDLGPKAIHEFKL